MKLSTRSQLNGAYHEVQGSVRTLAGRVTSNSLLTAKGKFEKFAGGFQRKIGKFGGAIGL